MPAETVGYKGRQIRILTVNEQDGWIWGYRIDDGPTRYCSHAPVRYQDVAVSEAIAAAKADIDGEPM